jgi:CxxC-x17-CxxC domain-containing protein
VRPETRTTCSECNAETTVPFKPTQGRPVLCRSCFQKQQASPVLPAAPAPSVADD